MNFIMVVIIKVSVAISGNHDHGMDKAWWNELWMGYPVGKEYREQSNITLTDKLQGHLLLVHGDVDDNVNVSSTLRFADALIKANKDFDLLIVPNQSHGEGTNTYITRRRWDYFVQNLLDVQPPNGFQLDKPLASFLSQARSAAAQRRALKRRRVRISNSTTCCSGWAVRRCGRKLQKP